MAVARIVVSYIASYVHSVFEGQWFVVIAFLQYKGNTNLCGNQNKKDDM